MQEALRRLREVISHESRCHLLLLLALMAGGVALRVAFLNRPMHGDEGWNYIHFASRSLGECLSDYGVPNNHLFHTALVHISTRLLGNRTWAIRLPAVLAGILMIPACYLAARLLYGKAAALVATACIAASPILVEFSTMARGYTLVGLLFLLLIATGACIARRPSLVAWICFAVFGALGFWTMPPMLYPFGMIVLWLAGMLFLGQAPERRRRDLAALAGACLATGLLTLVLYSPVLRTSGPGPIVANRFVVPLPWDKLPGALAAQLSGVGSQWARGVPVAVVMLMLLGFVVGLPLHRRLCRYGPSLVVCAVLWLPPVIILQRVAPFDRVFLFLLPLFCVVASSGLSWLATVAVRASRRPVHIDISATVASAIFVVVSASIFSTKCITNSGETGALNDAPAITAMLKPHIQEYDLVYCWPPANSILEYYFYSQGISRKYLKERRGMTGRSVVVTCPGQTVPGILRSVGAGDIPSSSVRLTKSFAGANVYEIPTPNPPGRGAE